MTGSMMTGISAQAQDVVKGNLTFLKDVKEIQISYVYDDITIGKDGKEATYIKRKKAEKESKEPGTGKAWEESRISDRNNHYQPKFNELFAK